MPISEKILLIITAAITAISALFCVISLATPNWTGSVLGVSYGLYCTGCPTASGGLAIVGFILLIAATVIVVLFIFGVLPKSVRVIALLVLFIASIFTLATFAAYVNASSGYSYKLMVVAHFFCYVASLIAAFWLGGSYNTVVTQSN